MRNSGSMSGPSGDLAALADAHATKPDPPQPKHWDKSAIGSLNGPSRVFEARATAKGRVVAGGCTARGHELDPVRAFGRWHDPHALPPAGWPAQRWHTCPSAWAGFPGGIQARPHPCDPWHNNVGKISCSGLGESVRMRSGPGWLHHSKISIDTDAIPREATGATASRGYVTARQPELAIARLFVSRGLRNWRVRRLQVLFRRR